MTKWTKKLSCVLLTALLLVGTVIAACAQTAPDLTRTDCSLRVVMEYEGKPVAGGSLTLYRVGEITADANGVRFSLYPELHCSADMEALQSEATAQAVSSCVQQKNRRGTTAAVATDGAAVFEHLETGLYLVQQETAAAGFHPVKPFLISLPQWDGTHYNYNVTAASKTELRKTTPAPEKPKAPAEPRLPQTGQLNWPVQVFSVLGVIFLLTGAVLRKKKDA